MKEYKDFVAQFHQKKAFMQDRQSCFVVDMDSQFLMVPKVWVHKLLIIRLMNLCISLTSELRVMQVQDFS